MKDLLDEAGIVVKQGSNGVRLVLEGQTVGTGPTLAHAVLSAFSAFPGSAQHCAQALFLAGALSFGPDHLFAAIETLWGDDDEDEDDEGDEDGESDEDEDDVDSAEGEGTIQFHRE